ncbi:hypothetical protein [Bradyrhizobium sp. 170]|uniref:hypothetical protein n=1 Tax=Bradyrhizobium sp. 170 TaxID=2782641 RepID=UPI002000079C|nr:hypothetical protein [Bradyrhizobium sp. 170]UPK01307.1 hypothetical protein IVB05_26900 [Bradyrhizobium sp. 170]
MKYQFNAMLMDQNWWNCLRHRNRLRRPYIIRAPRERSIGKHLFDQVVAGLHGFAPGERHDKASEVLGTFGTVVLSD